MIPNGPCRPCSSYNTMLNEYTSPLSKSRAVGSARRLERNNSGALYNNPMEINLIYIKLYLRNICHRYIIIICNINKFIYFLIQTNKLWKKKDLLKLGENWKVRYEIGCKNHNSSRLPWYFFKTSEGSHSASRLNSWRPKSDNFTTHLESTRQFDVLSDPWYFITESWR